MNCIRPSPTEQLIQLQIFPGKENIKELKGGEEGSEGDTESEKDWEREKDRESEKEIKRKKEEKGVLLGVRVRHYILKKDVHLSGAL